MDAQEVLVSFSCEEPDSFPRQPRPAFPDEHQLNLRVFTFVIVSAHSSLQGPDYGLVMGLCLNADEILLLTHLYAQLKQRLRRIPSRIDPVDVNGDGRLGGHGIRCCAGSVSRKSAHQLMSGGS